MQYSRRWSKNTKKVQFLNFGRLPPGQFSLDFKKNLDLGYFYLFLQHILGASKSGKLDDPLGGGGQGLNGQAISVNTFLRLPLRRRGKAERSEFNIRPERELFIKCSEPGFLEYYHM